VVEIWPRVLTGAVVKSDPAKRAEYLARYYAVLPHDLARDAASTEDAFDAAVSALKMGEHVEQLMRLPEMPRDPYGLEGAIWAPRAGARL
jgi:hypothetical protein